MKVFVLYGRADTDPILPAVFKTYEKAFEAMKDSFEITLKGSQEDDFELLTTTFYELANSTEYEDPDGDVVADIDSTSATIRDGSGWIEWYIAELEVIE